LLHYTRMALTPCGEWGLMTKRITGNEWFIFSEVGGAILGLWLLLACPAIAFAVDPAGRRSDPCSEAIVTRQPGTSEWICDSKTVQELARRGRVFGRNQLGMVSKLVIGPGYDPVEALKWFEGAALRGYAPAQVNLAVMYINGWGTEPNYGAALHWLLEAAHQGDARAYYNLGILYQQGQGVMRDPVEALRCFRKGAEAGDASAQANLGYMYDSGIGTAKDMAAAVSWYGKAAEKGNAFAQNNLADLYLRGEGVPQNDAIALRLFQQAAAQGQTGARVKLGYMYASGRGTMQDLVTADSWITAAAIAGDARGHDLMQSVELQLSTAQIARAKQNARNLTAETGSELNAQVLQP
jgi:TPR repeat protein